MFQSSAADSPVTGHVGVTDVERVEAGTAGYRAMDYRLGGRSCRQAVLEHVAGIRPLPGAPAPARTPPRLYTAVGDAHNLAGWTCFDTGQVGAAHAQFRQALQLARPGPAPRPAGPHPPPD